MEKKQKKTTHHQHELYHFISDKRRFYKYFPRTNEILQISQWAFVRFVMVVDVALFAWMNVLLIPQNELRFSGIRYQACLTIAATLFRAHPILSLFAGFCTNVGKPVTIDLTCTSLARHKMNPLIHSLMCCDSIRYDFTVSSTIKLVRNSVVFVCKNGTENWLQNWKIKKYADFWLENMRDWFQTKKKYEISILKIVLVW